MMKQIFCFVSGVAVGAIVALLLAPTSGQELRASIGARAGKD